MSLPQTQEVPTPTPVTPAAGSGPAPSPGSSTGSVSWQQVTSQIVGSVVMLATSIKLASWFGECLSMVRLPSGGVTHDPWSWAPLAADVLAIVAVASPTSWRDLLAFLKGFKLPGRGQ